MHGDLVYVVRNPLGVGAIDVRKNEHTNWLDQVVIRCLTYKHYGVEVENGDVIHFYCDSMSLMKQAKVSKVTRREFMKDGEIEVDHTVHSIYTRDEVVRRANSMLESGLYGYHYKYNNCEHFALWCVTGLRHCRQNLYKEAWERCIQLPIRTREKAAALMALLGMINGS